MKTSTIKNKELTVVIDKLGAELASIRDAEGTEYLWQGNPEFWAGRAYNLFPIVGRLYKAEYLWQGKKYDMGLHGFARKMPFTVVKKAKSSVTMLLTETEETLKMYPFAFRFYVTYSLRGSKLTVEYKIENPNEGVLPCSVGGHPGFNVPLVDGETFEQYKVVFPRGSKPTLHLMSENVLVTGKTKKLKLTNKALALRHDLFDNDALVLSGTKGVTLVGPKGKGVTMEMQNMPYVGIWHANKKPAPYVCLEPWASLPSDEGVTDDFATKKDFKQLPSGETYALGFTMKFF